MNRKTHIPILSISRKNSFLVVNGLIGLILIVAGFVMKPARHEHEQAILGKAAGYMANSLKYIELYCAENQIDTNNPEDPAGSGLIGPEWSEITTTVGDPAAKRTTLQPRFAALLVHLLLEAGVSPGDTVAIGSSGSFPALLIASLSACKALGVHPRVILSLGSSSFGASNPDFTLLDIYRLLMQSGLVGGPPVAASLGGEDDTGTGFEPAVAARLTDSLSRAGIPLITEKDLQRNVGIRIRFLKMNSMTEVGADTLVRPYVSSPRKPLMAFINCGGGIANIGSSPLVLKMKPGLVRHAPMPPPEQRGMVQAMLDRGVPVIHLLHIRGLARQYRIPWDPAGTGMPGSRDTDFPTRPTPFQLFLAMAGCVWFLAFLIRWRMLYNSTAPPSDKYV